MLYGPEVSAAFGVDSRSLRQVGVEGSLRGGPFFSLSLPIRLSPPLVWLNRGDKTPPPKPEPRNLYWGRGSPKLWTTAFLSIIDSPLAMSVSRSFNVTPDPAIAGNDFTGFEVSHIGGTI